MVSTLDKGFVRGGSQNPKDWGPCGDETDYGVLGIAWELFRENLRGAIVQTS